MSWSNVDESWWELRSESLHESFLNYHILVKRGWELTNESLHESFLNYHILVKRGWELMRVEKRDFVWEFFQLSCPGQTWMRVDESWEARACMRVFLTIMSWSNVDESWWELRSESLYESFLNCHVLVKRGWELMRVEKREFVWEFSQLSCPGQTRIRINEVEKREFVWEFSQLSCPGQTRMRVDESWEARVCMRVFSTIMSWSNEDESWWELRSESLYESFLNYHVLVKRGWELMRVEKREFVWEFSQLSCPGQTRMRVDESWEARVCMRVFSTIMSWSNED